MLVLSVFFVEKIAKACITKKTGLPFGSPVTTEIPTNYEMLIFFGSFICGPSFLGSISVSSPSW